MNIFGWFRSSLFKGSKEDIKNTSIEKTRKTKELQTCFHRLSNQGNDYYINYKVPYTVDGTLKPQTIQKVFEFAYKMAFTSEGAHRSSRSGGSHARTNGEIFANTFQGKIAECAACNFFYKLDSSVMPDFSVYQLGKWDTVDLSVCGKEIAIKSTKHFGQLLLLETKDWDAKGRYIPNISSGVCVYDYIVVVRVNPSCEDLLKSRRLLYSNDVDKSVLENLIGSQKWTYNFAGYITHKELLQIIKSEQVLPRRAMLNGKTIMDAENYYVQIGDLHPLNSIDIKVESEEV